MKIYHTATQEDYDALMIELEEKGRKWLGGEKPTHLVKFKHYGKDTYIYDDSGVLSFSNGYYFKAHCSNETLIEYKAKGENMAEEMKHKLQEVAKLHEIAFDVSASIESFARGMLAVEADLKEAKSAAKKLIKKIDEYLETLKPEFKVGDYVTVYVNGKRKIAKIDELTGYNSKAYGLWYDQTLVNVKRDYWFSSGLNKFRHATPEEIAEYEVALTFHEHGRKPFEVKKGDLIRTPSKKFTFILNPENYTKEEFLDYDWEFLKTAEEVNEWLGVTDDE
ncbi:MAG: hypothetical protein ACTINU_04250 [Pseudolactococcus laudensis]